MNWDLVIAAPAVVDWYDIGVTTTTTTGMRGDADGLNRGA